MQLKNSFYKIQEAGENRFVLSLNPDHFIYLAHFPGEPITPGVCIVQIGKELLEEQMGRNLELVKVKNVKFLSVVSPRETTELVYTFKKVETSETSKEVKVQMVVTAGDEVKAKVSLACR